MTCENYLVSMVFKFSDVFFGSGVRTACITQHYLLVSILYRSEAPLQQCVPFITKCATCSYYCGHILKKLPFLKRNKCLDYVVHEERY